MREHTGLLSIFRRGSDTEPWMEVEDTSGLVGGRTADCLAESLWSLLLQDMVSLLRGDPHGQRETGGNCSSNCSSKATTTITTTNAVCGA